MIGDGEQFKAAVENIGSAIQNVYDRTRRPDIGFDRLPLAWDWVDLATTLRAIENAYERALIAKAKLPPREVVFSKKRLEDWIEMHKDQDD